MKIMDTSIDGVFIIEPSVFSDKRGFFMETYHAERYRNLGIQTEFVQDNCSYSVQDTLRGLHFQHPHAQAKLVQVLEGEIYDVAVDIRKGSPTFAQWTGVVLNGDNKRQFYIPEGFAHGFAVLSKTALFSYKCSDFYSPESERGIMWNDPDLAIAWPIVQPILSEKDTGFSALKDMPPEMLPAYGEMK